MEGICPKCQVRLELPVSGVYDCERCRTRFEVAIGSPRPLGSRAAWPGVQPAGIPGATPGWPQGSPPGWPAPAPGAEATLDPSVQAPCAYHPGNLASHLCERCGDFMCRLCMTPVEGRLYCPRCFELLYQRGSLQVAHRQFTQPGITLGLGISALLMSCACLGAPFGIAGIVSAMSALKEYRKRPELPGRKMTLWGLGLSIASLVVAAVTLALFTFKVFNP